MAKKLDPNLARAVAQAIRQARRERGWTQVRLAEAAGLHYHAISGIERGARPPTLATLIRLLRALDRELVLRDGSLVLRPVVHVQAVYGTGTAPPYTTTTSGTVHVTFTKGESDASNHA